MPSLSCSKNVLVVCDVQPEFLKAVEEKRRLAFLDALEICLDINQQANDSTIIFTGLRFLSSYQNVPPQHKLFGGFRRLNQKLGDDKVNWFLDGYTSIEESILPNNSTALANASCKNPNTSAEATNATKTKISRNPPPLVFWRETHLPSDHLIQHLKDLNVQKVTVVGLKAAYTVQAVAQRFCDEGLMVSIVRECVEDDTIQRRDAILTHLLPIYGDVIDLVDYAHQMNDAYNCSLSATQTRLNYCCGVQRSGHAPLIMGYLMQRNTWKSYWSQEWYTDVLSNKHYRCPLGKFRVAFCDEPQFSQISMFLRGREWLDEKEKLLEVASGLYMPETYLVRGNKFVLPDHGDNDPTGLGPWFLKEANKNGGRAIEVCGEASHCFNLTEPTETYVLQRHINDPWLTLDGRKCHFKVYSLLFNKDQRWRLYVCKDSYISMSDNSWSPADLSKETQVTVLRHKKLLIENDHIEEMGSDFSWKETHKKSKGAISELVFKAIQQQKIQERDGVPQFEIFSADVILERTSGKLYVIEFNFSPVLYDPHHVKNITTRGLQAYHEEYERLGDDAPVNDSNMIRDAVSIVFDGKEKLSSTRWDLVKDLTLEKN